MNTRKVNSAARRLVALVAMVALVALVVPVSAGAALPAKTVAKPSLKVQGATAKKLEHNKPIPGFSDKHAKKLEPTPGAKPGDDDISGATAIPASGFTGTVQGYTGSGTDPYDCYSVYLTAGTTFNLTMTGPSNDIDVYLFGIGSTSVAGWNQVAGSGGGTSYENFTYTPTTSGTYYVIVEAHYVPTASSYTVTWSGGTSTGSTGPPPDGGGVVTDNDISGAIALPASGFTGTVNSSSDTYDCYVVSLTAGQSFTAGVTGPSSTDFDLYLFPPGSTHVANWNTVAAAAAGTGSYPDQFTYTPTTSGTYYLVVEAHSGSGTYSVTWSRGSGGGTTGSDNTISSAVAIPSSPFSGTVVGSTGSGTDPYDCYSVYLTAGSTFNLTMTGPSNDIDVYLFPPGSTAISNWNNVAGSGGGSSSENFTYTPTTSGTYYLVVEAHYVPTVSSYTITYSTGGGSGATDAANDIPSAVTAPASPISGSLTDGSDDWDVYAVALTAGQPLSVSLTGPSGSDFDLYLYAPGSGSVNTADEVAGAYGTSYPDQFTYTPTTSGTYYLCVYSYSGSGAYSLTWRTSGGTTGSDAANNIPGTTAPASPISESLGTGDDWDVYAISLQSGQRFAASLNGPAGSDFDMYLYAPGNTTINGGTTVASANGVTYPDTLDCAITRTGTYYLAVYRYSGTGVYSLTYAATGSSGGTGDAEPANNNIPGVALPSPSPVSGSLDENSDTADVYSVTLAAGETIQVILTSPDASTDFDLYLYGPGATSIWVDSAVAEAAATSYPDTFSFTARTAGTYYLEAYAYSGSGRYSLAYTRGTVSAPDNNIPGVAAPVSPISGDLADGTDDWDVYYLDLTAGQQLTASLTGPSGSDFDLYMFGPGATSVQSASAVAVANGTAYPDTFTFTVPTGGSGRYYLGAYCYSGSGSYSLTYSRTTPSTSDGNNDIPGRPIPASPVSEGLDQTSDRADVWSMSNAQAGETLSFDLTGPAGSDYDLYLYGPTATSVYTANAVAAATVVGNDTLRYTVPSGGAGTYYMCVWGYSGTGSYSLVWSRSSGTGGSVGGAPDNEIPGVVAPASPVSGHLGPNTASGEATDPADVYRLALAAGQRLTVSLSAASGTDFDMYLFGPGSTSIYRDSYVAYANATTYPDRFTFDVPAGRAGTYYLSVYQYSGAGDYTLTYGLGVGETRIGADPTYMSFSAPPGVNPAAQQLAITNAGAGTLTWRVTESSDWLSVSPASGTNTGRVTVSVTPGDLRAGTYVANMTITAAGAVNSPMTVPVRLTVGSNSGGGKYAVLIGMQDYPGVANDLQFPHNDVSDMRSMLINQAGYDQSNILVLQDSQATRADIQQAITGWLDPLENADSQVAIYYSGHGSYTMDTAPIDEPDGRDETIYVYDGNITDDTFGTWMDTLESNHIMVALDSCYSGGFIRGQSGSGDRVKFMKPGPIAPATAVSARSFLARNGFARDLDDGSGRVVISASDYNQTSVESPSIQNGAFTYYFVEAFGAATADSNSNSWISAQEAFAYTQPLTASNYHHTPQMHDGHSGALEVVDLSGGTGTGDGTGEEPPTALSTDLELSDPGSVPYGGGMITATLRTSDGEPIPERDVRLESSTDGDTWEETDTMATDSDGVVEFNVAPEGSVSYRAVFEGDDNYDLAESNQVDLMQRVALTQPAVPAGTRYINRAFTVSGYLSPQHTVGAVSVRIYTWRYVSGRWVAGTTFSMRNANSGSRTRYAGAVTLRARGSWRMQAVYSGNSNYARTSSSYRTLTVR